MIIKIIETVLNPHMHAHNVYAHTANHYSKQAHTVHTVSIHNMNIPYKPHAHIVPILTW